MSTIAGVLMEIENCQIRGQVSQGSRYWMKNNRMNLHGSEPKQGMSLSLMDLCHLKNSAEIPKKYLGRVVLRGDIVKDDSGCFAVFAKQGSSASQMTAAKVMDIISRLPKCSGQTADAVSAYTQVKNGRCTKVIEKSQVRMSTQAQMAKIIQWCRGDVDQVTNSGTTALLRRRLPTRTCQFHMALQLCVDQVGVQDNGPMSAVSSCHLVSGIFACFIRDARFRKTMIEMGRTEEVIREMDKLANEDHTHTMLLKKNSTYTVANGGSVRILLVLTRCP